MTKKTVIQEDPVSGFKYRVTIVDAYGIGSGKSTSESTVSLGFSRVSGLEQDVEEVTYREGTDAITPRKFPGLVTYPPLMLERGLTTDTSLLLLAKRVADFQSGLGANTGITGTANSTGGRYRFMVVVTIFNRDGNPVRAYTFHRAWIRRLSIPDLDSGNSSIMIESMEISHEGMEIQSDNIVSAPTPGSNT